MTTQCLQLTSEAPPHSSISGFDKSRHKKSQNETSLGCQEVRYTHFWQICVQEMCCKQTHIKHGLFTVKNTFSLLPGRRGGKVISHHLLSCCFCVTAKITPHAITPSPTEEPLCCAWTHPYRWAVSRPAAARRGGLAGGPGPAAHALFKSWPGDPPQPRPARERGLPRFAGTSWFRFDARHTFIATQISVRHVFGSWSPRQTQPNG